jgi:hypothetical protein
MTGHRRHGTVAAPGQSDVPHRSRWTDRVNPPRRCRVSLEAGKFFPGAGKGTADGDATKPGDPRSRRDRARTEDTGPGGRPRGCPDHLAAKGRRRCPRHRREVSAPTRSPAPERCNHAGQLTEVCGGIPLDQEVTTPLACQVSTLARAALQPLTCPGTSAGCTSSGQTRRGAGRVATAARRSQRSCGPEHVDTTTSPTCCPASSLPRAEPPARVTRC